MKVLLKISLVFYFLKFITIFNFFNVDHFGEQTIWFMISVLFLFIPFKVFEYSNLDENALRSKRWKLLFISIISLPFSFFAASMIMVVFFVLKPLGKEELASANKVIANIDPERKKLDILLKLGAFLVVLSGVIFATTSWDEIPAILKVFSLLLMSGLFFGLFRFSDIKLKIIESTKIYWFLSSFFLVLSYLSLGFFELLGDWFSLSGEGYNLFLSSFILISCLVFYSYYKKFNEYSFLYLSFSSIVISIILVLNHFEVDHLNILLASSVLVSLLFLVKVTDLETEILNKFASYSLYVLFGISVFVSNGADNLFISNIVLFLFAYISLTFTISKSADKKEILYPILISLLFCKLVYGLTLFEGNFYPLFLMIGYSIIYISMLAIPTLNSKDNHQVMTVLFNIILFFTILIAYDTNINVAFICSLLLFINHIIIYIFNLNSSSLELFSQPFKILCMILVLFELLNSNNIVIVESGKMAIILATLLPAVIFVLNIQLRNIYFLIYTILSIFSLVGATGDIQILNIILLTNICVPYLLVKFLKDLNKDLSMPLFLLINIAFFYSLSITNLFSLSTVINSTILIITYLLLIFIFIKDKNKRLIPLFFILIPTLELISSLSLDLEYKVIIFNLISNVLIILFVEFLGTKDSSSKTNLITKLLGINILYVIVQKGIPVGLYMALISMIFIFVGLEKKEYGNLLKIGVFSLIFNVIIQMWDLWTKVPFWLYLLVTGLSLIGIVSYKEIKKLK